MNKKDNMFSISIKVRPNILISSYFQWGSMLNISTILILIKWLMRNFYNCKKKLEMSVKDFRKRWFKRWKKLKLKNKIVDKSKNVLFATVTFKFKKLWQDLTHVNINSILIAWRLGYWNKKFVHFANNKFKSIPKRYMKVKTKKVWFHKNIKILSRFLNLCD